MNTLAPSIVASLEEATGLKCYYEAFVKPENMPCLSYYQLSDVADSESLTLGIRYSRPYFRITLHGKVTDMQQLMTYRQQLDECLWGQRYKRTNYLEMVEENYLRMIFTYTKLNKE